MGKKGSWISALRRVFASTSKDKLAISGPDRDFVKDKKRWAIGKLRNGGTKPFINLHKEPSSIEEILGDAEREHHKRQHHPQPPKKAQHQSSIECTVGNAEREHHNLQHHPQPPNKALHQSSIERTVGNAEREHHKLQHHPQPPNKAQHQGSIERTVGNAEREHHKLQHHPEPPNKALHQSSIDSTVRIAEREQSKPPPQPPQRAQHPKALPDKPTANARPPPTVSPSRITINYARKSAIKIQAAYRGYMARKNYRALKGLVRLQRVMRGQSVKRQTMNALRLMQLFVRVQSQVRMRRIQAMEGQNPQRQGSHACDKEQDSNVSRWSLSHKSDAEEQTQEVWDSSLLTKEEIDARTQRKVEAVIKRERALAYATSHQPLKALPKSPHPAPAGPRPGGVPVWWGWLERHFQSHHLPDRPATPPAKAMSPPTTAGNRGVPDARTRDSSRGKRAQLGHDDSEACTPRSTHAPTKPRARPSSPGKGLRNPPPSRAGPRDDESLTSCPAFTAPGYMAPTLSAKAKVREQAFPREAPPPAAKKRFSFGLSQSIGALRWGKGVSSLFAAKEVSPQRARGKHRPTQSIGNLSVDSTASLPVGVGRRPFK